MVSMLSSHLHRYLDDALLLGIEGASVELLTGAMIPEVLLIIIIIDWR